MNNEILRPIKEIATLVKLGEKEHLQELQRGYLYLNKILFFKELKHDQQRADIFEGALGRYPKERFKIKIRVPTTGESIEPDFQELYIHDDSLLNSHIFCAYAIHSGVYGDKVIESEEMRLDYENYLKLNANHEFFGGHLLFFKNLTVFFERLDRAVKNAGFILRRRAPISFFDSENYEGDFPKTLLGFLKPLTYQHQNEYRILIQNIATDGPYKLFIGDLSDISVLTTIEEFNNELKVELPSEG